MSFYRERSRLRGLGLGRWVSDRVEKNSGQLQNPNPGPSLGSSGVFQKATFVYLFFFLLDTSSVSLVLVQNWSRMEKSGEQMVDVRSVVEAISTDNEDAPLYQVESLCMRCTQNVCALFFSHSLCILFV